MDFPGGSDGKATAYNAGDPGSFPGSGRSPGEGNGNPLQYSCLEKSHRQRSLVDCSPWDCRVKLDLATKQINKLLEGKKKKKKKKSRNWDSTFLKAYLWFFNVFNL